MELKKLTTTKKNGKNSCQYIMLHHTAIGGDKDGYSAARYLSGPQGQGGMVSCQYVVGRDGTKWKIGDDSDRLWHAGDGDVKPFVGYDGNSNMIGIEIDSNGTDYTKEQFDSVTELVTYLTNLYKIPVSKIIRHADYSSRKWDVGPNFFKIGGLTDLQSYQNYILTKQIMNDYKKIFTETFPNGSTIYKDLEGASLDLNNPTQITYFIAIGLERLKTQLTTK